MTDLAKCKLCGSEPTLHPRNKWELYHPATMGCSLGNPHIRLPISVKHWQALMGECVEERPKPKTLSNAKAPKPGQGIPQSVAGQRLDPEFLAETAGRVDEAEPALKPLPDYGDHMAIAEWAEDVEGGMFTDYDGHGNLATATRCSNSIIAPSQASSYQFPAWATHIVWYNK